MSVKQTNQDIRAFIIIFSQHLHVNTNSTFTCFDGVLNHALYYSIAQEFTNARTIPPFGLLAASKVCPASAEDRRMDQRQVYDYFMHRPWDDKAHQTWHASIIHNPNLVEYPRYPRRSSSADNWHAHQQRAIAGRSLTMPQPHRMHRYLFKSLKFPFDLKHPFCCTLHSCLLRFIPPIMAKQAEPNA